MSAPDAGRDWIIQVAERVSQPEVLERLGTLEDALYVHALALFARIVVGDLVWVEETRRVLVPRRPQ